MVISNIGNVIKAILAKYHPMNYFTVFIAVFYF